MFIQIVVRYLQAIKEDVLLYLCARQVNVLLLLSLIYSNLQY